MWPELLAFFYLITVYPHDNHMIESWVAISLPTWCLHYEGPVTQECQRFDMSKKAGCWLRDVNHCLCLGFRLTAKHMLSEREHYVHFCFEVSGRIVQSNCRYLINPSRISLKMAGRGSLCFDSVFAEIVYRINSLWPHYIKQSVAHMHIFSLGHFLLLQEGEAHFYIVYESDRSLIYLDSSQWRTETTQRNVGTDRHISHRVGLIHLIMTAGDLLWQREGWVPGNLLCK